MTATGNSALLAFGLLGLLMAPTTGEAQASGESEDRAAIRALVEAVEEANEAGDVEAWVGLFAEDFVYMPPGSPAITTREALVETAEAGFRHTADIEMRPEEIVVAGDWAFARTHVTGTVILAESEEIVDVDVKQIVIYARAADGRWRISRMIMNSNS